MYDGVVGRVLRRDAGDRDGRELRTRVRLLAGVGVEGDLGVRGASRRRRRGVGQVHLLPAEVLDEFAEAGHELEPGELGENVTTRGIDLARLPLGTRLQLGAHAVVRLDGVRGIDGVRLEVFPRGGEGRVVRRAGVMAVVEATGFLSPGDAVRIRLPGLPYRPLPSA
ncbi:MOSC domain-containing protein [Streptomyces sp. NPDC101118]|uniref:MOSC domain-containing protein n=1 Tax=Streptomyces sp. NPDC101118 TaxID=3366109 RepID=UPI003829565D